MKFLRVIRFDDTDERVFDLAASDGEIAVSGAFEFAGMPEEAMSGRTRIAFATGFMGVGSLGRATFACIANLDESDVGAAREALCELFVVRYGAPSRQDAETAASEEMDFVAELCGGKPVNTVFAVQRALNDEGHVVEQFREISAPGAPRPHARIWDISGDDA